MKMGKGKQSNSRFTITLTPGQERRLSRLEQEVDLPTKAAVIREALRLYEYFVRKRAQGYDFILEKEDEQIKVELFLDG